jgi:hypothetical protein
MAIGWSLFENNHVSMAAEGLHLLGKRRGLTGKAIVVSVGELIVDEDRMGAVLVLEPLLHTGHLVLRDLKAGPAVPLEVGGLAKTAETGDEAARGHRERVASIFTPLDRNRKSIGEEKKSSAAGRVVDSSGHVSWIVWRSAEEGTGSL